MWRDSESDLDFLNFTDVADQIATLATSRELLPISIGVFGTWGTGKSTVLKLVENTLKPDEKRTRIVKFDAWLYQGFDDSRAALMEVVSTELLKAAKGNETVFKKVKKFAKRINYFRALGLAADFGVGMALGIPPGLLTTAGAAVTALVQGSGKEAVDKFEGDAKEAFENLKGLVKPGEKRSPPEEIDAFRKEFGELLEELDITLVLFIDNLDRCLPDVAIGTLEAIRLFLFMPRTAFVIAADEGMIRHSVAKYFSDPQATHVRDYLDKVIQVPLRVPQVGVEDLRAYMYSLFAGLANKDTLVAVQKRLLEALQQGWKNETFTKDQINELAGKPDGLLDNLAVADRLAAILATAPNVQGNPRIVKRLLNSIVLRRELAKKRKMNIDLATLAKLAVFERCTDSAATLVLYRMVMDKGDDAAWIAPPSKDDKLADFPADWKTHEAFISKWREMEPAFNKPSELRPAVFLSRDVMAPARTAAGMSATASQALEALMALTNTNSPVSSALVERLNPADRKAVMGALIEQMRGQDWSKQVAGLHGSIVLAQKAAETSAELKAFVSGLTLDTGHRANAYLIKQIQQLP
jgi:hypothetical protein